MRLLPSASKKTSPAHATGWKKRRSTRSPRITAVLWVLVSATLKSEIKDMVRNCYDEGAV